MAFRHGFVAGKVYIMAKYQTPMLITHIIGFAVGHWWQGRLIEGVGLMALFFGGFWLADATK